MKTLILTLATLAMITSADARERYRSRHRVWAAPFVGGLVLGTMGYYGYDHYYRPYNSHCWNEFAGTDRYGNDIYERVCR